MQDYSRPLGDALKRARGESGYTQRQVADKIGKDVRTVLKLQRKS